MREDFQELGGTETGTRPQRAAAAREIPQLTAEVRLPLLEERRIRSSMKIEEGLGSGEIERRW